MHIFHGSIDSLTLVHACYLLHSADASSDGSLERFKQQIKVNSDGTNLWLAPIILLSSCKIYVKYFPFDEQHCKLKFGSWTYDGYHLDVVEEADEADGAKFSKNGEWELIGVPSKRSVVKYVCCDAPYPDVTYTVKIRRRTLFFFFNMVIPCLVIVGKRACAATAIIVILIIIMMCDYGGRNYVRLERPEWVEQVMGFWSS